jgi:hypothetical protein
MKRIIPTQLSLFQDKANHLSFFYVLRKNELQQETSQAFDDSIAANSLENNVGWFRRDHRERIRTLAAKRSVFAPSISFFAACKFSGSLNLKNNITVIDILLIK